MIARFLIIAAVALGAGGCAGKPVRAFEQGRPLFEPQSYFAGRTHSWGVVETPAGQPGEFLSTRTEGRLSGRVLDFEQEIDFEGGKSEHRSWLVRRVDAHRYSATGTGIVGMAQGEAWGNVFHLSFTLDALPGNPLGRVRMSQWMYLQPDGVTLVNRDTLSKFGVIVAEITEEFRKDR